MKTSPWKGMGACGGGRVGECVAAGWLGAVTWGKRLRV